MRCCWRGHRFLGRNRKRLCKLRGIPSRHGIRWSCGISGILWRSPKKAASQSRPRKGCTRHNPPAAKSSRKRSWRPTAGPHRGVELTAAGLVFLDRARLALAQAEAAPEAARRAAQPIKPTFALGFLTGQEMDWLSAAMNILQDELPKLEITVSSPILSKPRGRCRDAATPRARHRCRSPERVHARSRFHPRQLL
jgi:hypothetical protein